MAGCYVNPCSEPESKLLTLTCSGCTAPMTGEGTLTASLQQCKFLVRYIPAARLIEHSSAIYALPKYTDLPNTGLLEKPAVEVAELDAVAGVYKTEEQAKRWMLALCVAGIKENALRITAGPSLLDEKASAT